MRSIRLLVLAAAAATCARAATAAPPPTNSGVQPVRTIDLSHCLSVASGEAKPDSGRCPAFVSDAFKGALEVCRDAGGKLGPAQAPAIWSLDVNGDQRLEYLFELGANVQCEGAYSIFECGSSDCAQSLYEQKGGAWIAIGALAVSAPESIEVLSAAPGSPYRELRVGCVGEGPCNEFAHYQWGKQGYELRRLHVRGHWVTVPASVQGLKGLTREIAVRATPTKDGAVLDRYGRDTEVIVLGEIPGTPYYYVSPCNACESGFVERSAVRAP